MRSHNLYLTYISESIEKILEYTKEIDFENFIENSMVFDAVVRNFEIIGEAAKNIPESIKSKFPHIPWTDMVGMRNILIHGYFGVDYSIVWNTIGLLADLHKEIAIVLSLYEKEISSDQETI
jgi:uncharacterized protein with HEPN domain